MKSFILITLFIFSVSCNDSKEIESKFTELENQLSVRIDSLENAIENLDGLVKLLKDSLHLTSQQVSPEPTELTLSSLTIINEAGDTVAEISSDQKDGTGRFELSSGNAESSLLLTAGHVFSGIQITNRNSDFVTYLSSKSFTIMKNRSIPFVKIGITDTTGNGGIWVNYHDGTRGIYIRDGFLTTYNKYSVQTSFLGTNTSNDGSVLLFDQYGKPGWGESGVEDKEN